MNDNEEIINVVETLFQAGITKNLETLKEIHLNDPKFSSFSDLPPYDLKDYQTTIELEELRFVSISDYTYEIKNPKISIFGDTASCRIGINSERNVSGQQSIHRRTYGNNRTSNICFSENSQLGKSHTFICQKLMDESYFLDGFGLFDFF